MHEFLHVQLKTEYKYLAIRTLLLACQLINDGNYSINTPVLGSQGEQQAQGRS